MTDTRRFTGHAVLVTRAARGIGAATARRAAAEGARVLLTDVDLDAARRTAADLAGSGEPGSAVEALACDVGDRASVEAAVARAVETFGALDVLVNNACAPDAPHFEDEPDEVWARDIDVTLTGAYRCCRAALPYLAASGCGAIVNIGSVNGLQDFGNHAYSAAKAGPASLTRTLAGHSAPRGVRVNLVAPGTVRTTAWEGREAGLAAVRGLYPLGRVGEPDDIAAAVAFRASRDASWTTLVVDGGLTAVNRGFRRALKEPAGTDREARTVRTEGSGPVPSSDGAEGEGVCGRTQPTERTRLWTLTDERIDVTSNTVRYVRLAGDCSPRLHVRRRMLHSMSTTVEPSSERSAAEVNEEIRALWLRSGGTLSVEQRAEYQRLVMEWANAAPEAA